MVSGSAEQSDLRPTLFRIGELGILVLLLDRLVSWAVTESLGPDAERHSWWLIGDAVGLEYVRNTGAAFGLFRGNPEMLAAVSILVCVGFVWLILVEMSHTMWAVLAAGLLVGGALGNLLGRVMDGYVTDYIAVGPWPRFNVADSAITVGVVIFGASILFGHERDGSTVRADEEVNGEGGAQHGG